MTKRQATIREVQTPRGVVRAADYAGEGSPIVLLHGYFDDSGMYARLVSALSPRRTIALDFLGYGRSGRLQHRETSALDRVDEVKAVMDEMVAGPAVIVGHCGGGPVALELALAEPNLVKSVVLLNTYFGESPTLRFPEALQLMAAPKLSALAVGLLDDSYIRQWLLRFTAEKFGYRSDPISVSNASEQAGDQTVKEDDALPAIRSWARSLSADLERQNRLLTSDLDLRAEVKIVFGLDDPYFNAGVAEHLAQALPGSRVHMIDDASHWPHWDQTEIVARIVASAGSSR